MPIGQWLDNTWGSLFGSTSPGAVGSSVYGPPASAAPSTLGGLLDPAGIRQQAAWSGLGALSAGLIAAGQRRPAASPSLFPQALGAFQPAYSGALSTGYQQAAAERQMAQQQEQEQAWQTALQAASPAERSIMQSMGRERWGQHLLQQTQPYNLGPNDTRFVGNRPVARGTPAPAAPRIEGSPETGYWSFAPDASGRMVATPIAVAGSPTPTGQPPPGIAPAGEAPPGGAPSGQPATPGGQRASVGVRNNNWLSMSPGGSVVQYETPEAGVAAASQNLDRLFPSGTVTPRQLVQMWAQGPNYDPARVAPGIRASVENYGTAVARAAGVSNPDQPINLRDPATRLRVMQAMGQFETGGLPQGADEVLARGVALAAQPGASFRPSMPRQAGGGAPAQPGGAPAPAAAAPAAPAAAAPPPVTALIPDRNGATAAPIPLPQGGEGDLVLRRPPGALVSGPTPAQITQASTFSSHFINIPEVRNALRVTTVLSAMEDAATRRTAASDLNLVYGLITILDPGSVVREGESVTVRSTQSVPDRFRYAVEQALSGQSALSPEARAALMAEARGRVQSQVETYNTLHGNTARLVRSANLNPDVVLGPRATMPQPARAPEPQPGGGTATRPPPPPPPAAPPPQPARPGEATARVPPRPISAEPTPQEMQMLSIGDLTGHADNWDALTPAQQRAVRTETRRRAGLAP